MRSYYELGIIERITESKASKALVSGGRKLQKVTDLQKIYKSGIEGFTGGAIAQAILRASGHDLGIENNRFLERIFSAEEFEDAKLIAFMGVRNPVDFKVVENGETRNISLEDMHKSRGMIMDIGDGTVDKYSEDLQAKEIRIRAGPLGVYEKGFKNGIELTRRIAGDGLVFLGGDTSQEVVENGLDQHIISTGGQILISGGSALHRLAGGDFPSINLILEMYGR
jgi:3-phosphoglycerate kinase